MKRIAVLAAVALFAACDFGDGTGTGGGTGGGGSAGLGGGAGGGTGGGSTVTTTLVEPLPTLSASVSSVAVDGSGVIHALELGSDSKLRYLRCASGCDVATNWAGAIVDPGVSVDKPVLRVTADGRPRIAIDNFVTGTYGDYIGFCDADCTTSSNWSWTKLELPASISNRNQSHYFAVSGDMMMLGLGVGSPMSTRVCTSNCKVPSSWWPISLSSANCGAPDVAISSSGAMVFSCVTYDFNQAQPNSLEVWSCGGDCTDQSHWFGVAGLAVGDGMFADATIAPDGRIGIFVNGGKQSDPTLNYHLGYFTCGSGCGQPTNWENTLLPGVTAYSARVAIDTDAAGRTAVAFGGTQGTNNGLFIGKCATNCTSLANWTTTLLDDAKRLNMTRPETPPSGCTTATWVADRINGLSFRGGLIATTSGYGVIATGGSCFNNLFSPSSAYTYVRSVVSFGVTGY